MEYYILSTAWLAEWKKSVGKFKIEQNMEEDY